MYENSLQRPSGGHINHSSHKYGTVKKLICILVVFQSLIVSSYFGFVYYNKQAPDQLLSERSSTVYASASNGNIMEKYSVERIESADIYPHKSSLKTMNQLQTNNFSIAVGMGITSRLRKGKDGQSEKVHVEELLFFKTLMPSFCETASPGFLYHFYIAFDFNDPYFSQIDQLKAFNEHFSHIRNTTCSRLTHLGLNFVNCSHSRKPAWAQNDAMMSAYMDDNDYFYRINDDTKMKTKAWTEIFINKLLEYDPPNIGVVGPSHSGGNTNILTYDFVHRSHVDVFGFYYPRDFTDWHGDRWITEVYKPDRITKISSVKLKHTLSSGTRYKSHRVKKDKVAAIIQKEKTKLQR